jgi:hypothetical protein
MRFFNINNTGTPFEHQPATKPISDCGSGASSLKMWVNRGQLIGHLIMLGKIKLPSNNEASMPGQLSIP